MIMMEHLFVVLVLLDWDLTEDQQTSLSNRVGALSRVRQWATLRYKKRV
jgi:hypothetical protein